jgi:hypothetical protein
MAEHSGQAFTLPLDFSILFRESIASLSFFGMV